MLEIRLQQISDNIQRDLELLKDYEDALRLEEEPRRRAKYNKAIEELRTSVTRYQSEFDALGGSTMVVHSEQAIQVSQQLRQLNEALADVIDKQFVIHAELRSVHRAILGEFNHYERSIAAPIVAQLSEQQLVQTQAVMHQLSEQRIPEELMQETLSAVREILAEIRKRETESGKKVLPAELDALPTIIDDPKLEIRHRIKVTTPIIPFLIAHEAEISLNHATNLQFLWARFFRKVRGGYDDD
jgi:preprotein translocase subunit SecD